jgi:hypothetical protein
MLKTVNIALIGVGYWGPNLLRNIFNYNHRSGDVVLPRIKWEGSLKVEIEHFVGCVQNGTSCLTGVDHAKNVVKILSNQGIVYGQ